MRSVNHRLSDPDEQRAVPAPTRKAGTRRPDLVSPTSAKLGRMAMVAGIDGSRGGWAVAVARMDTRNRVSGVEWHAVRGQDSPGVVRALSLARDAGAVVLGIDAPIGLPDDDWRPCDLLAKRRLGRGSARVFLVPPRDVLAAPTYADARAVARQVLGGHSVSAQAYGLRGGVLALDGALRGDPEAAATVVEVHPELSFMAMSGRPPGDPLPSKRTPGGRAAREAALAAWLLGDADLDAPGGDDHLDALAAAWSAHRWAAGAAEVLGGDVDRHGLPMRMVI